MTTRPSPCATPRRWIARRRIFLAHQGRLVALAVQGDSPQVLWEYVIGSHVPGPIVVAADGTLRAHSGDGFLHAVTPEGKQLWSPAHVGEPLGWAAPVVDAAGNTWVSAYDGGLIHVDANGKMSPGRRFRSRQKLDSAGILARRRALHRQRRGLRLRAEPRRAQGRQSLEQRRRAGLHRRLCRIPRPR